MKMRSVQAFSVGLSAVTIAASTGVTAYAAEITTDDAQAAIEETEDSTQEEAAAAQSAATISGQLNNEDISGDLQETVLDTEVDADTTSGLNDVAYLESDSKSQVAAAADAAANVQKAAEAIGESLSQMNDSADEAQMVAAEMADSASDAKDKAAGAIEDVTAAATAEEADAIVSSTEVTLSEAEEAYASAQDNYNNTLSAYLAAKDDYDTARYAYIANKEGALKSLDAAEQDLDEALATLETITEALSDARDALTQAGIDYWKVSGYYVPVYVDYMHYTGTRYWPMYDSTTAITSGMDYVRALYSDSSVYYKSDIAFSDDWQSVREFFSLRYDVTGSFTATYVKAEDLGGYSISSDVAGIQYSSKEDAIAAVVDQARTEKGASGIDTDASDIITEHVDNQSQVDAYTAWLNALDSARGRYRSALEQIIRIKTQIAALDGADDAISIAELARLEAQLASAQAGLSDARASLDIAKISLETIKQIAATKVSNDTEDSTDTTTSNSQTTYATIVETIIDDVLEEEEIEEPELEPETVDAQVSVGGIAVAGTGASDDGPEDIPQDAPSDDVTVIEEDPTPAGITVSGLLERGEWFVGLAGVSVAGAGVAAFEAKRRAAAKIIDKLNQ